MTNSYKSKKTKTIEQIPCFLKDGSKREDPTKIRREDGVCVKKKCDSSHILNPETGECIDKSTKKGKKLSENKGIDNLCLLYTSPSPRDATLSRMPSSA